MGQLFYNQTLIKLKKFNARQLVSGDYKSRDHGCVTRMLKLKDIELLLLEARRK